MTYSTRTHPWIFKNVEGRGADVVVALRMRAVFNMHLSAVVGILRV